MIMIYLFAENIRNTKLCQQEDHSNSLGAASQ